VHEMHQLELIEGGLEQMQLGGSLLKGHVRQRVKD